MCDVSILHNAPGQPLDGLIYQTETYDGNNTLLERSTAHWSIGDYLSPQSTDWSRPVWATRPRQQSTATDPPGMN